MTSWWAAQKILKTALLAPFKSGRVSLFVCVIFVLPVLLPVLGIRALSLGLFGRNLGSTFYAPDGAVDPVIIQHLMWLSGSQEMIFLASLLLVPFVAWAQAVWIKGQSERVTLIVGWGHFGRILGVYLTAAIALVIIGAVAFVLPALVFFALPVAVFVMFRFAPVLTATSGGDSPVWRYNHVKLAVILWCVLDFIVVLLLLGLPAGIIQVVARAELMSPGDPSFVGIQSQFLLAFLISFIAWVYGLFVLTAMVVGIANKGVTAQASLFR